MDKKQQEVSPKSDTFVTDNIKPYIQHGSYSKTRNHTDGLRHH